MHVLLLTFDTFPRRWLGCYGGLECATRQFDRLASLGTIFDTAISPDVREQPASIAGLKLQGKTVHTQSGPLPADTCIIRVTEDDDDSQRRRTDLPPLVRDLHRATTWLRDQPRGGLVWVQHEGLDLPEPPAVLPEDLSDVIEQVTELDESLEELLDEWTESAGEDWTLIITSGRGITRPDAIADRRNPTVRPANFPVDDLIRVPLMILEGRGTGFGRRELAMYSTSRLGEMLPEALSQPVNSDDPAWSLAEAIRDSEPDETVQVTADEGLVALRTADWLFIPSTEAQRDPGEGSLFQKPEDVCDVFDVRTTRLEVAIELESLINR